MKDKYNTIFSALFRGCFINNIRGYFVAKKKLKELKKINFKNTEKYFKKYKKKGNVEKNVLVELLIDPPQVYDSTMMINMLLGYKNITNAIGLIKYSSYVHNKYLARKYNIHKFVYVFGYKNIIYKFKAILPFLQNLKNLAYSENYGWHVCVEGVEIGDLIYDEYLRALNIPTLRTKNLHFLMYIYNSIFYFYRIKDILIKNNITDIILSHNVYVQCGVIAKVAGMLDKDIKLYGVAASGIDPLSIYIHKANREYIRKHFQYSDKIASELIKKYGKDNIIDEYSFYMKKRLMGEDKTSVDSKYVYKNLDIKSSKTFFDSYSVNKGKKNIFIHSHAFVDAVKSQRWSLYSDYYTWLQKTLESLSKKSKIHNIFVKEHPTVSLYKCKSTVKGLVDEINYKFDANFIFLDKKVHNSVIFDIADAIITSNGTIGLEAGLFNVPVLIAAAALYDGTGIAIQPHTKSEYLNYLENIDKLKAPSKDAINKAKIYFMMTLKYLYAPASFLRETAITGDPVDRYNYEKYNEGYGTEISLKCEPLYKSFSEMVEAGDDRELLL